ncbi:hypothetical protein [Streptomyces sp. 900105245]
MVSHNYPIYNKTRNTLYLRDSACPDHDWDGNPPPSQIKPNTDTSFNVTYMFFHPDDSSWAVYADAFGGKYTLNANRIAGLKDNSTAKAEGTLNSVSTTIGDYLGYNTTSYTINQGEFPPQTLFELIFNSSKGTFEGPWQLPGSGYPVFVASRASVAATPNGAVQAVALGMDGRLYHSVRGPGFGIGTLERAILGPGMGTQVWQPWGVPRGANGAPAFGGPDVAITGMPNNDAQIIAIGIDNVAYHNIRFANGSWQGWAPLQSASRVALSGCPGAGSGGDTVVAILDGNKKLSVNMRISSSGASSWKGWSSPKGVYGAPAFTGRSLSVATNKDGDSRILAIDEEDQIWSTTYTRAGVWGTWALVSRDHQAYEVSLAGADGVFHAAFLGTDGFVYQSLLDAAGKWGDFTPLPDVSGNFQGSIVGVARRSDGASHLLLAKARPGTKYFVNNTNWALSIDLQVREGVVAGQNDIKTSFSLNPGERKQVSYSAHQGAAIDAIILNFVDNNELFASQLVVVTAGSVVDHEMNDNSTVTFNPSREQIAVLMSFGN